MAQFIQMICPNCGGDLVQVSGDMFRCENCHVYHKIDNRNLHHDLLDVAAIRESLNFRLAEQKCRKLLQEYANADLTDVYWNLLLCEQRVVFETDQKGAQFPSFYDIVPTDIESSENYKKCNEYLKRFNSQNAYNYEELVDKMISAKRKYRRIKESSKPFDIFICFKKSRLESEGGGETRDYKIAYQLYNVFCKSYNVFFSEESLFNIGGVTEYEPHIYHALYTAKIMFLICSKREYLESQWVKNEWSRFKRMADNAQQTKVIIPIFVDDFTPEYLPDDIKSCQGLNNDMYLIDRLKTSVNNFLHPVDKEAELNAKIEAEIQRRLKAVTGQRVTAPVQQVTVAPKPATKPTYAPKPTIPVKPQPAVAPKPVKPNYIVPYGTTEIKREIITNANVKTAVIPDTVTSIGDYAFRGCSLTNITMPSSITNISFTAFSGCNHLQYNEYDNAYYLGNETNPYVALIEAKSKSITSCTINKNTKIICESAFSSCNDIKNIIIPDSVTNINDFAFSYCGSLTSVMISDSVVKIGSEAFTNCRFLMNITVSNKNKKYHSDGNCLIETESKSLIAGCKSSVIPTDGSVTSIGVNAFHGSSWLGSITVPDSVTSIGDRAFDNCTELTSVTISNGVMSIGSFAFDNCSKLTSITYKGTKKQWMSLTKGYGWNDGTGKYVVHCTDGDLKKSIFNKNI